LREIANAETKFVKKKRKEKNVVRTTQAKNGRAETRTHQDTEKSHFGKAT